ncbi:PREDICTED: centrosomal protein of 162 kDa [Nanorana parkeri]|uniref:centrosomal protein of 162 kDa n=1 Tax=Nanorana parkeri TaxID=125878 RepID=UPI000854EA6B|nr:PREDICTED: centrosomal protein of 162 kDa [Nanorana parkeri]
MSHRLTKEELDDQFEQFLKESLSDDSFDSNKKSMVLENLGKPIVKRNKKKDTPPWWAADDDSEDGDLVITSRSFRKSQSTSQPIEEVEEENQIDELQQSTQDYLITSMEKDSLEIDESVMAYGPNKSTNGVGLDTLEEQEEKENFFARLEKGASSTIDYSRLNKELDSTDSTQLTALICNNETPKTADEGMKELSENYSEDFEDDPEALSPIARNLEEHDGLEDHRKEEENHGMLAKVMLDSMDSTIDTQKLLQQTQEDPVSVTPQETNEAIGTGISNQYTNSEMEALHLVYQNLNQLAEDTDEQKSNLKATSHTSTSFVDTADLTGKSLQKIPTGESDMSTVDELMQPFRGDQCFDVKSLKQSENKEPGSVGKNLKGVLGENENKIYLQEWHSGKSELRESFSVPEFDPQHDNNKNVTQNSESQQQLAASKEPGQPERFTMHQRERSGHVVNYGNYPVQNKTTSGLLYNKHSNKTVKSPTSVLKKGQNAQYAFVKSSGYGKTSTATKPSSAPESFQSKTYVWHKKEKSPIRKQQRDLLSDTRTIRFAEDVGFPEDSRTSNAQMLDQSTTQGHSDSQGISRPVSSYEITSENESAMHYSNLIGRDLTVLQRLQNVEEKLNAERGQDFSRKEEEFKLETHGMKAKYEEEIKQLKQENYKLEAKLHAEEEKFRKRNLLGDKNNPATEEKLQPIRQEIEEQETLLKGYQQENERLYQQVKELQLKNKENEGHMFKENQALKANLISLREKLNGNAKSNQYAPSGNESNNQGFTELIAELRTLRKRETSLLDDIARCKQEKQAVEVDLVQLKKERDFLKTQVSSTSDEKSYAIKMMEESYKQEISRLNKRLQWFAENQEMLDKDAARLRDAYEQIEKLKSQVEKLTQNAGNQSVQQQQRLKDRSADAKRIQDLERQVKEMEGIIKRRHPNSIPAIMYAAAAASETDSSAKSSTVSFLERRIQKLESDLESKDEEAKKSLRSMEQQFQKVKIQYESRINELEELLAQKALNEPQNCVDSTIKVKALEQELSIFKEAHHITVMNLQKELETFKEKNSILEHKGNAKFDEMTEQSKLTRLNKELTAKHKEIQELSKTVERLQKERMLMLSSKRQESSSSARSKHLGATKAEAIPPLKGNTLETESFPAMLDEKLYQPDTFADFHISDLQQENERLQAEVHKLSQEINQQNIKYETVQARGEDATKRLKEENAEQIAALKNLHQRNMEKLICQHAIEHSSSRVAELSSKTSTQEILIKHLQKQVSELQKDRELLAVLHIREETLQNEVTKLLDELKTARECHTPEMRHYLTLESKIKYMEMRHSQREQELQQVIQQTRHAAESVQTRETYKWKKLVQQKNMELEKFRSELDAILDVLRVLQRQGIVIPTTTSEGSEVYWRT